MELEIKELAPIEWDKTRKVVHIYKRVKTADLTAKRVSDLFINLGFDKIPVVTHLKGFYLLTFYPKPPVLISEEDGRMYTTEGMWDLKEAQHQASLIMRVLAEFGLVEEHRRVVHKRKTYAT